MELQFDIELTKKQKEAYELLHSKDCQTLVARWSRQCGKTVFSQIMLIEYLCQPNTFNVYISPSFSQGRKVYSEIYALLQPTNVIAKANASELRIETVYGSVLKFFSMESPTAIRGTTCSGILVLDECAFFPAVLPTGEDPYWNVIYPITKARKPKILCISTPNGKQGIFHELYLKAVTGEKGYKEISATIYDDQLISLEEIEALKKNYPPLAWRQEFEVEFLSNALTVFPNFESCFTIDTYTQGKCWCGIDPSTVGTDNTILTFVNDKNEVKQFKIDGTLDEKYSKIANYINQYKPVSTYIEDNSIGIAFYNEVRKLLKDKSSFLTFTTTNESKKEYISRLGVVIANNEIHFEKSNTLLFSELSTFTYKLTKNGNVTYAAKEGSHDDTVTSLGIALQCKSDMKAYRQNSSSFIVGGSRRLI